MKVKLVKVLKNKIIHNKKGSIYKFMNKSEKFFQGFGEIYFSTAYPNVVKGWHEHTKQVQNYAVIVGMIKLVLYDNRKDSETFQKIQELFIGEENYCLVTIPPGIVNGYKCIGESKCIVANCSNLPHEPGEMIRHNPKNSFINYLNIELTELSSWILQIASPSIFATERTFNCGKLSLCITGMLLVTITCSNRFLVLNLS